MKAILLPLEGKYYGTKVEISEDNISYGINLWNNGNFEPSDRELDGICTIEQWRNNEILPSDDSWYPNGMPARLALEICDSHFESRETYSIACRLVDLINASQE